MSDVSYPYMRREAIFAVAAVADRTYQERVWVKRQIPYPDYYDALDEEIHWLFDDLQLLPEPGPADGDVLLPGDECERLRDLGAVFDPMIDRLGGVAESDADYLADPEWPKVVDLAQRCLPAFILAGGWEYTETDAELYRTERARGRIPTVTLSATRRRVIKAVAALADEAYQRRTWPDADTEPTTDAADSVTGSLAACLHTLTDDAHVLPDPRSAIGQVLLAGDEIDRLATLRDALEPFRADPPAPPWHSPHWPAVVAAGLHCLPALVIAGAWIGPDQSEAGDPTELTTEVHP